ncbi:MAG TPA: glycoside hydrolase 100 family protein [Gammaproteobacteria bacterium]|nr:glycoside hydrolase 100 family protein [Gammaproteobacteria bacterium]
MTETALDDAYRLLHEAEITLDGRPVGVLAAVDPRWRRDNYRQCFVRDFVPAALVHLANGSTDIVRNFLDTVIEARGLARDMAEHQVQPGVMPASFWVAEDSDGSQRLRADFGDRAIGRVAPVDAMMWWTILLCAYVRHTGDAELARTPRYQQSLRMILTLCLQGSFEIFPTLLVPEGAFMIDRRMGVDGHPLEIQALFYATLECAHTLCEPADDEDRALLERAARRQSALRSYVRSYYWLDLPRLDQIHRFTDEDFDDAQTNIFNIHPHSVPLWLSDWVPDDSGYLAGNVGPALIDYRFFAQGNLLSILFGLASDDQAHRILNLFEARWDDLIGAVPLKICFPALDDGEWKAITGADPKNRPWSYHNGGNWPVLLWPFVAAALKSGRRELADRAVESAHKRVPQDKWPEYYDGRHGRLTGHRAHFNQVWSATALILAHQMLDDPSILQLLPGHSA